MHVQAMSIELHIPASQSLKEKRAVLRPLIEGIRNRFTVSVAEVEYQDLWQRARIGVAVVSGTATQVDEVLDSVERFIWSHPDIAVIATERSWLDPDSQGRAA